jgi:hypothetical protein
MLGKFTMQQHSKVAMIVMVFVALLGTSTYVISQNRIQPRTLPTDPCETIRCTTESNFIPPARVANLRESSQHISAQNLSLERGSSIAPTVDNELARARECSAVVRQYRTYGLGVVTYNPQHYKKYIDTCFHGLDKVPEETSMVLRNVVARLYSDHGTCSALILNSRVAVTARHCYLNENVKDISTKITNDSIKSTVLTGVTPEGEVWSIKRMKIYADPFGAGSLAERLRRRKANPATLDFILITPDDPGTTFPASESLQLVSNPTQTLGGPRQRLLLPSFPLLEDKVRIDDLLSCLVIEVSIQHGYFQHACQTLRGSSGAPVFIFSDQGRPSAVLGLHGGAIGLYSRARSKRALNEGILWPPELIQELQDRRAMQ